MKSLAVEVPDKRRPWWCGICPKNGVGRAGTLQDAAQERARIPFEGAIGGAKFISYLCSLLRISS